MRTHTHHRLKLLAATMVIAVSALAAQPATADQAPTYRAIELPADGLSTHGEATLRAWIDAWYEGRPLRHWSEAHPDTLAAMGHEAVHAFIVRYWEHLYIATYEANLAAEREAAATRTGGRYVDGVEVCNGTYLPPCHVVRHESNFQPNARNPRSTAWGLYQFLRGTWNSVCPEYQHGSATVAQQVECARRLWDNGRGRSHWSLTL